MVMRLLAEIFSTLIFKKKDKLQTESLFFEAVTLRQSHRVEIEPRFALDINFGTLHHEVSCRKFSPLFIFNQNFFKKLDTTEMSF